MKIKVKVKPGSSKEAISILEGGSYLVYLKERAIDGKANNALVRILSDYFNVKKNAIKIKNLHSRVKYVEVLK